jgi:hypothetical protein
VRGFVILAVAVLAAGCGPGSDRAQAKDTAGEFLAALQAGDGKKACKSIGPAARRQLTAGGRSCAGAVTKGLFPPLGAVDVVRMDGSKAFVVTTGSDQITLEHSSDGWKVTGLLRRTLPPVQPRQRDR